MSKRFIFGILTLCTLIGFLLWTSRVAPSAPVRNPATASPLPKISHEIPETQSITLPAPSIRDERFPPGFNYALAATGAKVTGGIHPELINDGVFTGYTSGAGYAYTQWNLNPPQSFLITMKEPAEIDCVRFLLWDLELDRYYRYKLEIAPDLSDKNWSLVADKSGKDEECKGWQLLHFARQKVQAIRLTGTYNSANSKFHVVELQACIEPPHGFPKQGTIRAPGKPAETLEF